MDHHLPVLTRTDSQNVDFAELIKALDANLQTRNGDLQQLYNQYNKVDMIRHVVIAYVDKEPAGCGAIKDFEQSAAEVKRMFVSEDFRGKGIAGAILAELEQWARELGYQYTILETGTAQTEAINLYRKKGYLVTDNYGQYAGMADSICFKKKL